MADSFIDKLLFFLPVVEGTGGSDHEDSEKDSEALNPCYMLKISLS
jgi:hypothetical protein